MEFEANRFMFAGREILRAFKYSPQALQMVEPVGERRHKGVCVVPQLLGWCVSPRMVPSINVDPGQCLSYLQT